MATDTTPEGAKPALSSPASPSTASRFPNGVPPPSAVATKMELAGVTIWEPGMSEETAQERLGQAFEADPTLREFLRRFQESAGIKK